ncbi:ASCH domain-containing protein [Pseudoroseomonas globiformis]|uniref:ASCH domain-containing protein n=1 Tax=Teichococcus globiformis TaxID=2307229 RepID=A0ABV7FW25_9PROT
MAVLKEKKLGAELRSVLEAAFPGQEARYFLPMSIGNAPEHADEGAALILEGRKTLTSSPLWDYLDGTIPFVGALGVLLDGAGQPRGVVETTCVEIMPFRAVTEDMVRAYGEGERTLEWWQSVIGNLYRTSAIRHGATFTEDTPLIWEWFRVVRRL